jgi:hypothetical protein
VFTKVAIIIISENKGAEKMALTSLLILSNNGISELLNSFIYIASSSKNAGR